MSTRRMIHESVVCSDSFIEMSYEAQAAFIQLQMKGDDEGFVNGSKRIIRSMGLDVSILDELDEAGFIFRFDSGLILMRHWHRANSIKKDRKTYCIASNELDRVIKDENKVYQWKNAEKVTESKWNPNGIQTESKWNPRSNTMESQNSVAKPSREKPREAQQRAAESEAPADVEKVLQYAQRYIKDLDTEQLRSMLNDGLTDACLHKAITDSFSNDGNASWATVKKYL